MLPFPFVTYMDIWIYPCVPLSLPHPTPMHCNGADQAKKSTICPCIAVLPLYLCPYIPVSLFFFIPIFLCSFCPYVPLSPYFPLFPPSFFTSSSHSQSSIRWIWPERSIAFLPLCLCLLLTLSLCPSVRMSLYPPIPPFFLPISS